jgi:tRNA acetyltransferase TAN1
MDLLISYSWGRFYRARNEARRILKRMGDSHPSVEWSAVYGIAVAHTSLNNREVINQCRELLNSSTEPFDFAVKWVPVDYWCRTNLDAIRQVIETQVTPRIQPEERWAMEVHKRRWQLYHTADIVAYLAPAIDRKVDLTHPDKIVWVDVIGRETAISILTPEEIFSAVLELEPKTPG